jgi:hypothetical protein
LIVPNMDYLMVSLSIHPLACASSTTSGVANVNEYFQTFLF